ncbi:hypothetical protein IHQ71_27890 [Rhizobium sp. TH2]|nr:hypothetical protein IHQ71_27890 [Rhizobium sp. TH2]
MKAPISGAFLFKDHHHEPQCFVYNAVRASLFAGKLTQDPVTGMEAILDASALKPQSPSFGMSKSPGRN